MSIFKITNFQITRPDFHFGVPKQHDVATKLISYERHGEILFQKLASGYLLHFVQDGSSKNALEKHVLRKQLTNQKIWGNTLYRSEGFPRTGYFVLACVGSGRWANFESCSRIHACGFPCFCRKVWFRARGAHISRKSVVSCKRGTHFSTKVWFRARGAHIS